MDFSIQILYEEAVMYKHFPLVWCGAKKKKVKYCVFFYIYL